MNVYAVFLVFGQTIASIGPWPDAPPNAMASCQSSVPASNAGLDKNFAKPEAVAEMRKLWPNVVRADVTWTCITSPTRPYIKDGVAAR